MAMYQPPAVAFIAKKVFTTTTSTTEMPPKKNTAKAGTAATAAKKKTKTVSSAEKLAKPSSGGVVKVKREPGVRKSLGAYEIKDPSLKMIGKAGGNPSVAAKTPYYMRITGDKFLRPLVGSSGIHMISAGRNTLSVDHVRAAYRNLTGAKVC